MVKINVEALRELPKKSEKYKAFFEMLAERERPRYISAYGPSREAMADQDVQLEPEEFRAFCSELEKLKLGKYANRRGEVGFFWSYNFKDVSYAALRRENPDSEIKDLDHPEIRAYEGRTRRRKPPAKPIGVTAKKVAPIKKPVLVQAAAPLATVTEIKPPQVVTTIPSSSPLSSGEEIALIRCHGAEITVDLKTLSVDSLIKLNTMLKFLEQQKSA